MAQPPSIELITMTPGDYLYTYWGHAALRVVDKQAGTDIAYNFGSIDFSGQFFMRMLNGEVDAFVGASTWKRTVTVYAGEDRTIVRRILSLPPDGARLLALRLDKLARSREHYRYHHFFDNCSTRVADEIDLALGGQLRARSQKTGHGTLRDHALLIVRRSTLLYVVLDVVLTDAVDEPITIWDERFLPERFELLIDEASIKGSPVVTKEHATYRSKTRDESATWTWPWTKVYLLFVLPLMVLSWWRPRAGIAIFGIISGLLGFGALLMWLGTAYDFLQGNWNVLVLLPTNLVVGLLAVFRFNRLEKRIASHLLGHAVILLLLTLGYLVGAIPQQIGPVLGFAIPPTLLLLVRLKLRTPPAP